MTVVSGTILAYNIGVMGKRIRLSWTYKNIDVIPCDPNSNGLVWMTWNLDHRTPRLRATTKAEMRGLINEYLDKKKATIGPETVPIWSMDGNSIFITFDPVDRVNIQIHNTFTDAPAEFCAGLHTLQDLILEYFRLSGYGRDIPGTAFTCAVYRTMSTLIEDYP